jgi:putative intracellular protease/amidase
MKVYLYVLDGMADWEIAYLTTEIASRRYFKNKAEAVELVRLGNSMDSIITMGGFKIEPEVSLGAAFLGEEDLLVLPGADSWLTKPDQRILELAKTRIEGGLRVAAICGATVALARLGALDDIGHTSNGKGFLEQFCPEYKGSSKYRDRPAVRDGNVITASATAPVEFAYEIIKMLDLFRPATLSAWLGLNTKREARYFYELMDSMKED